MTGSAAPVQGASRSETSVLRYLAWASVAAGLIFAAVAWALGDIFYLRLATDVSVTKSGFNITAQYAN